MGKSTISMENHHVQWVNQLFPMENHHVQWVNQLFSMENHHVQWVNQLFLWKITIIKSTLLNPQYYKSPLFLWPWL